jgi:mannose-P-dolichol utilization defect 1
MIGILAFFGAVAYGSLQLPPSLWSFLPLSNLPLLLISRIPQILQNFKLKSTGQLSSITTFLTFAGSLARVFTTIQEVGWDFSLLTGYFLGLSTSGTLLLQVRKLLIQYPAILRSCRVLTSQQM